MRGRMRGSLCGEAEVVKLSKTAEVVSNPDKPVRVWVPVVQRSFNIVAYNSMRSTGIAEVNGECCGTSCRRQSGAETTHT